MRTRFPACAAIFGCRRCSRFAQSTSPEHRHPGGELKALSASPFQPKDFMYPNQLILMDVPRRRRKPNLEFNPKEFKVQSLRECPTPAEMQLCDTPDKAAAYWRAHLPSHPYFNPDVECFVTLLANTRRKIQGHVLISTGTLDTILVHPREVFRPALIAASAGIVLMHNQPSGDPTPSEADIKVTRDLIRAGQLLKIEVLDHLVMGQATPERADDYVSLRGLGYFVN
jgi:hypothetical protein